MRDEQRTDHASMTTRVDAGFAQGSAWMHAHELSDERRFNSVNTAVAAVANTVKGLEGIQATAKWFVRAALVAVLAMLGDVLANHLGPKIIEIVAKGR